jgi:PLP dependent protein
VIVANVEQGLGVFAAAQPDPHRRMLDRFLVVAGSAELDAVAGEQGLLLGGVMAVAPPPETGVDPAAAFARLQQLSAELRERHPGAWVISAGMSGDMEQAVQYGATHLRIGTALLGNRPAVVG